MTKTEGQTLDTVVPLLGEAYRNWKQWEKDKESHKAAFFALASETLGRGSLALKMIAMEADSETQAIERALLHHPGWMIDTHRPKRGEPGVYDIILKEDPTLQPFSFEHEGVKYSRTISKGAVMVDDDWLQAADPDLYQEVTYPLPWGDRVTVPIELLEKETLGRLMKYIYNAKPRASLAAPRPVKDEG